MKDNDRQTAVKSTEAPTVGADHHPRKVAKGKSGAGVKPPARKRGDRAPTFAEMVKLGRAESAPAATSKPARTPAKLKAVVAKKAPAKTKKAKPESRSVKPAKVEEPKSAADPGGPAPPESEAGFSSTTQVPPGPQQVKPAYQSLPGHTPASGPEAAGSSAPKPPKPRPGATPFSNGSGVPQELSAAKTGSATDFDDFTPPGDRPGGDRDGEIDSRANGRGPLAPPPSSPSTGPANDLGDRGIGRLAIDPTRTDHQPEVIAVSDASTNNRIEPHFEAQVRPGYDGSQSEPADILGTGGNQSTPAATPALGGTGQPPLDPFDPARLRMSQDFAGSTGVKKLIVTIPVEKPSKEPFVRTHPDPAYRLLTGVIELKQDRETYLVAPTLWAALAGEPTFIAKLLVTTITRQGVLSLWPIRMPGPDGRIDEWNRSALEAADAARDRWVRVTSNIDLGAYETSVATGISVEPEFPDMPMKEILRVAFKGKYIDSMDHPVLRKLRGEV